MLTLFKSGIAEDEVLAKAAVKLRVEIFCLAWCSNSLRIGRGTLPIGAPGGLGVFSPHNRAVPPCTTLQWKEEVRCIYPQVN